MGSRSTERELYWRELVERQDSSGLGIAAFCRQESLSAQNFYLWKRKLLGRNISTEGAARDLTRQARHPVGPRLLPVRIEPRSSTLVRVYLPQGITFEVTGDVSETNLAVLLRHLREA